MFVSLSSTLVAFVKLRNLSDGFVEDPKSAFPLGHLVTGRVLRADGGSVEITLKSIKGSSRNLVADLESLEVGETVMGSVKRVEKFGESNAGGNYATRMQCLRLLDLRGIEPPVLQASLCSLTKAQFPGWLTSQRC